MAALRRENHDRAEVHQERAQEAADRLSELADELQEIFDELQERNASQGKILGFAKKVRRNCSL